MSQEWLKQLAELSNDKDLRKRAQKLEKAQRTTVRPAAGRQRGLVGAAFGHFFRWLFLFGLVEAVVMFVVADNQGLTNESWGYIFHYVVWYALTQPVFPTELYVGLQDWFGLTPAALSAVYDQVNPILQAQQDALVFYVPAGAALALTLFFLPVINAGRRRSPIRFLVFLANLAVIFLFKQLNQAVIALWLGAFLFSFIGGRRPADGAAAKAAGRDGSNSSASQPGAVAAAAATGGPPGTGHGTALPSVRGRPLLPRRHGPQQARTRRRPPRHRLLGPRPLGRLRAASRQPVAGRSHTPLFGSLTALSPCSHVPNPDIVNSL